MLLVLLLFMTAEKPLAIAALQSPCIYLSVTVCSGNQEGVSRSEWYSYNPMLSVTTLGTSGSDRGSTLGGLDQSCQDFVLMASPVRGEASLLLLSPVLLPSMLLLYP